MKKLIVLTLVSLLLTAGTVSAQTSIHENFDVDSGTVVTSIDNTDAHADFLGSGQFTGDLWSNDQGTYLDTDVDVSSTSGGSLSFSGWQNLAGYTSNQVDVSAFAWGSTADMNLRFDNSMYVVQLERHDTSQDLLAASGSWYGTGFQMGIFDGSSYSAQIGLRVDDDTSGDGGSASIDTNQWHTTSTGSYGWGNPDGIVSPSPPGYYTPTNTVSATGSGVYTQYGYGANSLTYNGMSMPGGGSALTTVSFASGFSFSPVMYAS